MTPFEAKVICFRSMLENVYKDEGERECFPKLKMPEDATEDFTAMLLAACNLYTVVTGGEPDLLDFISVLNKLAVRCIATSAEDDKSFCDKVECFVKSLYNAYKDADQLLTFPRLDMPAEMSDDFAAILYALFALDQNMTGGEDNIIDFVNVLNCLAIDYILD